MNNQKIQKHLLSLPKKIKKLEITIFENKEKLNTLEYEKEKGLLDIKSEVLEATDESGKPKFSNAEKRKVETQRLFEQNKELCSKEEEIKEIQKDIELQKIELTYLYNTQGNLKTLYPLTEDSEMLKS